jgi:hypothetical protein
VGASAPASRDGEASLTPEPIHARTSGSTPKGSSHVRPFLEPLSPDVAASRRTGTTTGAARRSERAGGRVPLQVGSVIFRGTMLGHVRTPVGAKDGHMRFAIKPAGDPSTIDPRPILANWMLLNDALHPQGAKGEPVLRDATVSEISLLSGSQLERDVLSDPGVSMSACARHEVASGSVDKRVMAALAFLSRSGLKPGVATLRCGGHKIVGQSTGQAGPAIAISHINGVSVSGHQGGGSLTDATVRALLTLRGELAPRRIVSLMHYPHAPSTLARADHHGYIEIIFSRAHDRGQSPAGSVASAGHQRGPDLNTPPPVAVSDALTATQWDRLISRVAALPGPTVRVKRSTAAIPDPRQSARGSQGSKSSAGG